MASGWGLSPEDRDAEGASETQGALTTQYWKPGDMVGQRLTHFSIAHSGALLRKGGGNAALPSGTEWRIWARGSGPDDLGSNPGSAAF